MTNFIAAAVLFFQVSAVTLPDAPKPAEPTAIASTWVDAQPLARVSSEDSLAGITSAPTSALLGRASTLAGPERATSSKRQWLALCLATHATATFDAWTTRRALAAGNYETDPTLRPFAGSSAIYGAIQVSPLILDFVGYRVQHSQFGVVRKFWRVPQSLSAAVSLGAGAHNLSITR
ncbi:MAG: hypothetical protein WB869_22630 [Candidatus Acidiferrales bacterium]